MGGLAARSLVWLAGAAPVVADQRTWVAMPPKRHTLVVVPGSARNSRDTYRQNCDNIAMYSSLFAFCRGDTQIGSYCGQFVFYCAESSISIADHSSQSIFHCGEIRISIAYSMMALLLYASLRAELRTASLKGLSREAVRSSARRDAYSRSTIR
eukprot:COSAG02_NODE_1078_length_14712_cov_9.462054_5_plen_154_part_00